MKIDPNSPLARDLRAVAALGDEAHYEGTSRHPSENSEADAIIESYPMHRDRAALRLAFIGAYDAAASRQLIASSLFGDRSEWVEVAA